MENLNEKVEAFDRATTAIQRKPWGAIIVILVIYSYFLYKAGEFSSRDQIAYLKAENKKKSEQIDKSNDKLEIVYTKLLEKNNIIDRQEELIQYADSTVSKVKQNQIKSRK